MMLKVAESYEIRGKCLKLREVAGNRKICEKLRKMAKVAIPQLYRAFAAL